MTDSWGASRSIATIILLTTLFALSGCVSAPKDRSFSPPRLDTRYASLNHDSRTRYIILHFTQEPFERSLDLLTRGRVSSHYLVSDDPRPISYRLVDEQRRAWHAGQSYWRGDTALNASSIGIEIVNLGPIDSVEGGFHPYPPAQIDEVIRLVRDIAERHQVAPHRILGHSDIAPQRKVDPGPQFPWRQLFEAGLVPWPDESQVAEVLPTYQTSLPDAEWFQSHLAEYGFEVPRTGEWDPPTRRVLSNFQAKYRPSQYDGNPDPQTAAILAVLVRAEGRVIRQGDGYLVPYAWRGR